MPLFKGVASKAKPQKAIDYITKYEKAVIISSISLDDSRDYASQFKETCDLFGKGGGHGERKYYHFKLSCNPNDNPTPLQSHELAAQIASEIFNGHECVIATHGDTNVFHTHIIINSVNFETGKKFRMLNKEYADAKDLADALGEKMGLTKLEWREKTQAKYTKIFADEEITPENKYLTTAERNIAKRDKNGVASWKDALRQAVDEAKLNCQNRTEFRQYLKDNYDVEMPRNTAKTVSFIHPAVGETYAVRGAKLGADYTSDSIDKALNENRERRMENDRLFTSKEEYTNARTDTSTTTRTDSSTIHCQPTTQTGGRERIAPRSIGDISAELREIDATVKSVIDGNKQTNTRQRQNPHEPHNEDSGRQPVFQQKHKRSSKSFER